MLIKIMQSQWCMPQEIVERTLTQDHSTVSDGTPGQPESQRASTERPNYHITLTPDEDGRIVVECDELEGVVTDGKDKDEALANAAEAVSLYLEVTKSPTEFNLVTKPM